MIDFTLSDEQNAIRNMAISFASGVLEDAYSTYSTHPTQNARFRSLRPFYRIAVAGGLIKGSIPKSLGGLSGTVLDTVIMVEHMYKVDRSLSLTIFATGLGLSPVIVGGTREQKEEFLAPFLEAKGEEVMASLVHSEPGGTANWLEKGGLGLGTVARREGGEWVVKGEKVCRFLALRL